MTDLLNCDGYAFIGGPITSVRKFTPGVAAPLPWAVSESTANPSPRVWPYVDMHGMVDRIIVCQVKATSEALMRAELVKIRAACHPGALLVWQPSGQISPVSCTVLAADVDTPDFDPLTIKSAAKNYYLQATVTLRTRPYWLGPEVQTTPVSVATWLTITAYAVGVKVFDGASHFWVCATAHTSSTWTADAAKWTPATTACISQGTPFVAFVPGQAGSVPALTRIRYTHSQPSGALSLGIRSNAAIGFAPLADYSGTADTAASGGLALRAAMTTIATTIGTPPKVDVGAMAGEYLPIVRVKTESATPATCFYRFASKVQGAVGGESTLLGTEVSPVTASAGGYDVLNLGVAQLPAGRVQGSGIAWGLNTVLIDTIASATVFEASSGYNVSILNHTGQRLTSLSVKARIPVQGGSYHFYLLSGFEGPGGKIRWESESFTWGIDGDVTVSIPDIVLDPALGPWGFSLAVYGTGAGVYRTASNVTPDSAIIGNPSVDAGFRVVGQSPITIGATIGVQVRNSATESKYAQLDTLTLIPTDESARRVTIASTDQAAGTGMALDYLPENDTEHDAYIANATDTGISIVAALTSYSGPMLMRPGDNYIVGMADTPKTVSPTDASLIITTRARYLLPYTGV